MAEACWFAGKKMLPPCRGRVQWHHPIEQQRLKGRFAHGAFFDSEHLLWRPFDPRRMVLPSHTLKRSLAEILKDERNKVLACDGHHELVTNKRVYVQLPARVWDFAREYALEGMLENDLARQGRGRRVA